MKYRKYYFGAAAFTIALTILLASAANALADTPPKKTVPAPAPAAKPATAAPKAAAPAAAPAARPTAPATAPAQVPATRPTAPTASPVPRPPATPTAPTSPTPPGVRPKPPTGPTVDPPLKQAVRPQPPSSPVKPGSVVHPLPGGGTATVSSTGKISEVSRPDGLRAQQVGGQRRVEMVGPNGRTVIAYGHGGYVAHGFSYRGQSFVQRTYLVNGRPYVAAYRPYAFGGVTVAVYAPARYYRPGFYAYAYAPWGVPVVYNAWGWGAAPWFSVYGGFFTPYPTYAGPSFWLTDYMVANSLQNAYQAGQDSALAGGPNNFTQPMSADLKNQIAGEVQYQLQLQQNQAQSSPTSQVPQPTNLPIFDNRAHTLQVYTSLNALIPSGGECALTESDIVEFNGIQPADGVNANVSVRFSKSQDCPVNSVVSVPVDQIQEMSNHMMEVMEQGLADFQKTQGRNGIPASNISAIQTNAPFAGEIPPAEPNVQAELQQASQEGDKAFSDAAATASPGAGTQPQPPTLTLGQSQQQVISIFGQPPRRANVGAKVIFFYKDVKITFENDAVTDIQ